METPVPAWTLSLQPCVTPPSGDRVHPDGSQILSSSRQPTLPAVCPQPIPSSPSAADSVASAHFSELQHLRHERAAFQADLRELRAVHAEVRELVLAAQTLRTDLNQPRGQPLSPVQPSALRWSNPPEKPCVSTPVVDGGTFPDLPLPPWPEPDAALARKLGDLELSDAATSYRPVVSGSQQYPFVRQYPFIHALLGIVFQMLMSSLRLLLLRILESCSLLVPCPCLPTANRHLPILVSQLFFQRQSLGCAL